MEKALAIANEIIRLAIAADNPPTQMKLQKLMFFAHGWNLALFDSPLLDEPFQAWKYGPVIPSVYQEFKNFGVLGINREGTEMAWGESHRDSISWVAPALDDPDGHVKDLLKKIWDVFGKYTGTQLSRMTHAPGTPWTLARQRYGEDSQNIPMHDSEIKKYFKGMMAQNAGSAS